MERHSQPQENLENINSIHEKFFFCFFFFQLMLCISDACVNCDFSCKDSPLLVYWNALSQTPGRKFLWVGPVLALECEGPQPRDYLSAVVLGVPARPSTKGVPSSLTGNCIDHLDSSDKAVWTLPTVFLQVFGLEQIVQLSVLSKESSFYCYNFSLEYVCLFLISTLIFYFSFLSSIELIL